MSDLARNYYRQGTIEILEACIKEGRTKDTLTIYMRPLED